MTFKQYFLREAIDPDALYKIHSPDIVTFSLIPGIGYIYSYNATITKDYLQVNHPTLYDELKGTLVGPDRIKTKHGLLERYNYFYLMPGKTFADLAKVAHQISWGLANITILEGRLYKSQIAFWQSRAGVTNLSEGLLEKMLQHLKIDPNSLSYHFADVGDLTYKDIHDASVGSSKDREAEMEVLRQLHLSPELKKQTLSPNHKASDEAERSGFANIAALRNKKNIGDSVRR